MWKPRVGQEDAEIEGRRYLRSMSTSDRTQPVAMIVCLHGRFGNRRSFCRAIRHQFEQTPGLLLLFPDGTAFGAGWNDGRVADDTDDFGFLTKMIAAERARFPSIGRVCCTGMSNGAMMTFEMLRHHAAHNSIDCYAPVCGLLPRWPGDASSRSTLLAAGGASERPRVLLIVGMQDRLIPAAGGRVGLGLGRQQGEVHSLQVTCDALEDGLGVTLGEGCCRLEAERVHTAEERASADGRLRVIAVQEAGHVWPGCRGLGRWLPGLGAMPTFSAGQEILTSFLGPGPIRT